MTLFQNLSQICLVSDREEAVSFCNMLLSKNTAPSKFFKMEKFPANFSGLVIYDALSEAKKHRIISEQMQIENPHMISLLSPQLSKELQDFYKATSNNYFYYPCSESMKIKFKAFIKGFFIDDIHFESDKKIYEDTLCREGLKGLFIGSSNAIKKTRYEILKAAESDSPVLLLGETGCGKTSAARLIHDLSERRNKSFVRISIPDIAPTLIESTLYGRIEGSYTDAKFDTGLLKQANHGTVLIDEIGTSKDTIQTKFLSFVDENSITPVGSSKKEKLDVRPIFATNANMLQMLEEGSFRLDLFHRINNFTITLPPLRDRKEDIPYIAKKYLSDSGINKFLSPMAIERLQEYDWTGNIRDIHHCLERTIINSFNERIEADELDFGFLNC